MPNGQREQAEAALRAIEKLRAQGLQSAVLDQAEERIRQSAGIDEPRRGGITLGPTGLPPSAGGIALRSAVGAGESFLRGIEALANLARRAPVAGMAGLPELDLPRAVKPVADFEQTKQIIDEAFGIGGIGQLATDAVGDMVAMGALGYGAGALTIRAIGPASLSTRSVGLERLTGLISGAVAGAVAEPARTAPIPEEPPGGVLEALDAPGQIARLLEGTGLDETTRLQIGGAAFGAVLGGLFDAALAYRQLKSDRFVSAIERAQKSRSARAFLEQFEGVERKSMKQIASELIPRLMDQPPDVVVPEQLARVMAEQMSAERVALSRLSQIGRLDDNAVVRAVHQGNPEGVNVVKGVQLDDAQAAIRQLEAEGADLDILRFKNEDGTYDLLIGNRAASRPDPFALTSEEIDRLHVAFRMEADIPTPESIPVRLIGPDGTELRTIAEMPPADPTRMTFLHDDVADELMQRAAVVRLGPGRSLEAMYSSGYVRVIESGEFGTDIAFAIPRRPTSAQIAAMNGLVKARDAARVDIDLFTFGKITAGRMPAAPGGISTFTAQGAAVRGSVGRAVAKFEADMIGVGDEIPVRVRSLTKAMRQQYAREGAFEGQAAQLNNGMPVEYLGRNPDGSFRVRNPLTENEFDVKEVKFLNTTYADFEQLDQVVVNSLSPAERQTFTRLRGALASAGARTPRGIKDLEELAAGTGSVFVRSGAQPGEIQLVDIISGDVMRFTNIEAARQWILNYQPLAPDLTPTAARGLGFGMGFIGGGGPPLRPGERMPIPGDAFFKSFEGKGVGLLEFGFTPNDRLMLRIEKRTGVPVWTRGFQRLQPAVVARNNFQIEWFKGGPGLPRGVKPLKEIRKIAGGRKANGELITHWLESEARPNLRALAEADMTPGEIAAAKELRKWYQALFDRFGLDYSTWISDYAPHLRHYSDVYGNSIVRLWRETRGRNIPLPREIRFVNEMRRFGVMDIYELDAFVAAGRYLRGGANKQFLAQPWREVKRLISNVDDRSVTLPLTYYLEAIRGVEFTETRAMMQATMRNVFERLPGVARTSETARVADDFALTLLSMSYQATMGFRPGLAIRNLTQTLQTTWTLFGSHPGLFPRAVAAALTREGRDAAAAAGAVARRSVPVFAGEEILEEMPRFLARMSEVSLKMYTGADEMNRAIAYHMGRLSAEEAIKNFARRSIGVTDVRQLDKLRRRLLTESNAAAYDRPVINEFLKRLRLDAADAASFLGKRASDVTQFLYGRGNQPRWWRSAGGRFLGQFGTWPMWYVNFVGSTLRNLGENAGRAAQARFLGRLAIANMAVIAAGREVLQLDLGRWAAYNSVFYTGGPGAEVIVGLGSAIRGLSQLATLSDAGQPFGRARVTEGVNILSRVGLAFVPNFYAARDATRAIENVAAGRPVDAAAAAIGIRPTEEFLANREADALEIFLLGEPDPADPLGVIPND